jgi:dTDP-4-dehydrorhamnose 3,5-epimerase
MVSTIKNINSETSISGLQVIELDTFQDYRGEIWTVYSEEYCDYKFVADKITISKFGVLRGFHGDSHTAKLITCLSGQMQFAVVDLRRNSETYGNSETFIISDVNPKVVVVPPGCANAHLSLSDKCVFYYKWSEQYAGPESQVTVAWNDPDLNMNWAIKDPVLSERDKNGRKYKETIL